MIDEIIAENLPCNAIFSHKSRRSLLETLGQPLAHVARAACILPQGKRRARNLQLLLYAAPPTAQNGGQDKVRI